MNRRFLAVAAGLLFAIPAFPQVKVPSPAPEFVIRLVDGQQLLLSQYKGKVVALEFLQTTCPHCQACSSLMNRLYKEKEFGARGFQPLGVAFNEMAALLVPDYTRSLNLEFPVGVASRDSVMAYLQYPAAKMMYVPQLMLIDREGVIRAYYPGGDDFFKNEEANMRAKLTELLNEKPKRTAQKSKATSLSRARTLK